MKGLDQFVLSLCVTASRLYKNRPLYVWKYVEATEEKQELRLHPLSESYLQHTFLLPTFYTYPRRSILCLHPVSSDIPPSFPLFFRNDKLKFCVYGLWYLQDCVLDVCCILTKCFVLEPSVEHQVYILLVQ